MVKASKNINRRIQLLKEQLEAIKICHQNNRKLDKFVYKDYQQSLIVCKKLLREELLKTNINKLL